MDRNCFDGTWTGSCRRQCRYVGNRRRMRELGCGFKQMYDYEFLSADPEVRVYQKDVKGHFGCVNALELSPDERLLVSGGDDRRVLLWTVCDVQVEENPKPIAIMEQMHYSNIFSLAFSNYCERIYSAGNDASLFVHDIATKTVLQCMKAKSAFYNISTNPIDDNLIISASDDGRVRLHDLRHKDNTVVVRRVDEMFCAQFNPRKPNIVSVCSKQDGLVIYDSRRWDRPLIRLCRSDDSENNTGWNDCSVMYGQWNETGDGLFAVRSKSSPIYYNFNTGGYVEFSDDGFVNSCTVKSCSFISPKLVMTGSDDWNIYVWEIPDLECEAKKIDSAYRILKGHRSIVNHVRYSAFNRTLFSSGVEKIIKLWSEFNLNGSYYDPIRRQLINFGNQFVGPNHENVEEDLHMLSFFDSLTSRGNGAVDFEMDMSDDRDDENSDEESLIRHYRAFSDVEPAPRRGAYYVVSSPEMSEPELLDDDVDQFSISSSMNISNAFSGNSSEDSDTEEQSSSENHNSVELNASNDHFDMSGSSDSLSSSESVTYPTQDAAESVQLDDWRRKKSCFSS
uniref:WD_REPEATS_REGION domain-containing protein n=1 Tax=Syphacia muris TaxID=451379 RepID=A0A0N5ATS0_9BILA